MTSSCPTDFLTLTGVPSNCKLKEFFSFLSHFLPGILSQQGRESLMLSVTSAGGLLRGLVEGKGVALFLQALCMFPCDV